MNRNKEADSAMFLIVEAMDYQKAANMLLKGNIGLNAVISINALFAIELLFKSILYSVNNMKKDEIFEYKHHIYEMYKSFPNKIKEDIKRKINIDTIIVSKFSKKQIDFESFEEELEYIDNYFIDLRYQYEKIINGKEILVLTNFIMQLMDVSMEIAIKEGTKRLRENN